MARLPLQILFALMLRGLVAGAELGYLEQIPVKVFAEMREVERYQLKIAEKHYLKEDYKVAADEYEKFLTLYEKSVAAPYAQLMWSHCQVKLRKVNGAIREGFQSVIDYWPDSHEAQLSGLLIARCYRDMGEVEKAEPAYVKVIATHPDAFVATLARVDQLEIAKSKKQEDRRVALLQEIVAKTKSTEQTKSYITGATRELAQLQLYAGNLDAALKLLETVYAEDQRVAQASELAAGAINHLYGNEKTRPQAIALADGIITLLQKSVPVDLKEPKLREAAMGCYNRIAAHYGQSGRPDNVLATYQTMGKLFGEDDVFLGRIAEWHLGRKERDKARAIYARFNDAIAGQGKIAGMWREEKQYDAAIEIYRTLITQDKEHTADYQWAIAECYEESDRTKLAIQSYRLTDRFPQNHFAMARCHRKIKETSEALALYFQAKANTESAPEASIQIGFTWEEAGKTEEAIKAFQQTCKQFPKSGQASQAHAHLQDKYKLSVTLGGAKDE